jgi:alkanesulfonate monooxygenase SsuD/methylene tetrahydromethanopterin reductase-like flavin-dependent oxidoreductase (luciferase family)
MRIGLLTAVQWSPEEDPAAFLKALREQVRAARDRGFSSLFVGQHLLTGPIGMFQTHPLLGQLAEDAAGMQIGPGVLLLSMMNPVLVAEEAATLDWLSDGNYVLGAGLGYRPEEFQAMGVDKRSALGACRDLLLRGHRERRGSLQVGFHQIPSTDMTASWRRAAQARWRGHGTRARRCCRFS